MSIGLGGFYLGWGKRWALNAKRTTVLQLLEAGVSRSKAFLGEKAGPGQTGFLQQASKFWFLASVGWSPLSRKASAFSCNTDYKLKITFKWASDLWLQRTKGGFLHRPDLAWTNLLTLVQKHHKVKASLRPWELKPVKPHPPKHHSSC